MVNGFNAKSIYGALEFRRQIKCTPYAGGTDLMVQNPANPVFLFLRNVTELSQIKIDDEYIRIGAGVTFTQALESPYVPKFIKEALSLIAAPAIRNQGTFGGNLGNGSAKADSVLTEYAAGAKLRLISIGDNERIKDRYIDISAFYKGKKSLDLKDNELIAEVLFSRRLFEGSFKYYYKKVGGRNSLAISRVSFGSIYNIKDGKVDFFSAAFGAVSDTVLRYEELEKLVVGKSLSELKDSIDSIVNLYSDKLVLTRGRVSAEYRKTVCLNLLRDCLMQISNS